MKTLITLFGFVVLLIVAGLIYVFSGFYNVAATDPHTSLTHWVMNNAIEHSVLRHAEGIEVPSLKDESMMNTGFIHYRENCAGCHTAPGAEPSEGAKGLYPNPPDLAKAAKGMTPAELFWVTKNGIKMSGMPAWGPTHSDDEIWAIVAFLEKLPTLTPADYQTLNHSVGSEEHHHHNDYHASGDNHAADEVEGHHHDGESGHDDAGEAEQEEELHAAHSHQH